MYVDIIILLEICILRKTKKRKRKRILLTGTYIQVIKGRKKKTL